MPNLDPAAKSTANWGVAFSAAAAIYSILMILLIGSRLSWSAGRIALWAMLSALLGLYVPLILWCVNDFPPLVVCEKCGKKRLTSLGFCQHCNEPWRIRAKGTEIFENPAQLSAFAPAPPIHNKTEADRHKSMEALHLKSFKPLGVFEALARKELLSVWRLATGLLVAALIILVVMSVLGPWLISGDAFFIFIGILAPVFGCMIGGQQYFVDIQPSGAMDTSKGLWGFVRLRPATLNEMYKAKMAVGMAVYALCFCIAFGSAFLAAHQLGYGASDFTIRFLAFGVIALLTGALGWFAGSSSFAFFSYLPLLVFCSAIYYAPNFGISLALAVATGVVMGIAAWSGFVGVHRDDLRSWPRKAGLLSQAAIGLIFVLCSTFSVGYILGVFSQGCRIAAGDAITPIFMPRYQNSWVSPRPPMVVFAASLPRYKSKDESVVDVLCPKFNHIGKLGPQVTASAAIANDLQAAILSPSGLNGAFDTYLQFSSHPEVLCVVLSPVVSSGLTLFDSYVADFLGDSRASLSDYLIRLSPLSIIAAILSACVVVAQSRRRRWDRGLTLKWAIGALFLGIYAPMLISMFLQAAPLEKCAACGKKRIVTREHCEHCGVSFAEAPHTGAEIFEPGEFIPSTRTSDSIDLNKS
jgi:ribosomal protein L32